MIKFCLTTYLFLVFNCSVTMFVLMSHNGRHVVPHRHGHTVISYSYAGCLPQHAKANSITFRTSEERIVCRMYRYYITIIRIQILTSTDGAVESETHLLQLLCLMCRTRLHSTGHCVEVCSLCASLNTRCARYFDVACL